MAKVHLSHRYRLTCVVTVKLIIGVLILGAALGAAAAPNVYAQGVDFPSGPVRILTGAPPGGAMDILARGFGAHLQQLWDTPVIVENRVGAAQRVAYSEFVRSEPDGHTLLITIVNIIAAHEYEGTLDADPLTVEWFGIPYMSAQALVVSANSDIRSIENLIDRDHVLHGEDGFSSVGVPYVIGLFDQFDVPFTFVPGYATTDLYAAAIRGEIDTLTRSIAGMAASGLLGGELRAIVAAGEERHPLLPDVPSIAEIGEQYDKPLLKGLAGTGVVTHVLGAPPGTDPEIVEFLMRSFEEVFAKAEFRAWAEANDMEIHDTFNQDVPRRMLQTYISSFEEMDLRGLLATIE